MLTTDRANQQPVFGGLDGFRSHYLRCDRPVLSRLSYKTINYLAESIGFEPMQRFHVDGLAIRCITTLPTLHNLVDRGSTQLLSRLRRVTTFALRIERPIDWCLGGESNSQNLVSKTSTYANSVTEAKKVLRLCVSVSIDTQREAFRFPSIINDLLLTSVMILLHCRSCLAVPQFGTPKENRTPIARLKIWSPNR